MRGEKERHLYSILQNHLSKESTQNWEQANWKCYKRKWTNVLNWENEDRKYIQTLTRRQQYRAPVVQSGRNHLQQITAPQPVCPIHNLHKTSTAVHIETHPSQNLNIFPPSRVISVWVEQQSKAWLVWSPLPLVGFGITGTSLEMGDWPWAPHTSLTGLESAVPVFTLVFLLEGHI